MTNILQEKTSSHDIRKRCKSSTRLGLSQSVQRTAQRNPDYRPVSVPCSSDQVTVPAADAGSAAHTVASP